MQRRWRLKQSAQEFDVFTHSSAGGPQVVVGVVASRRGRPVMVDSQLSAGIDFTNTAVAATSVVACTDLRVLGVRHGR
jgi:hypothetical protein